MCTRRRHPSAPRSAAACLLLTGALLASAPAPAYAQRSPAPDLHRRAVAIFTYHRSAGRLVPSRSFSGLLVGPGHVITSSSALGQGHVNPFTGAAANAPSQIMLALPGGAQTLVTPCRLVNAAAGAEGPLALLEIPENVRQKLALIELPPLRPTALEAGRDRRVIGVVAPEGHLPPALEAASVPDAVALPVRLEAPGTLVTARVAAAAVRQTLPRQMAGAGVWTGADQLMGVMVRHQDHWRVIDATAQIKQAERLLPPPPAPAARVVLKPPAAPAGPAGKPYRPSARPPLPRLGQLVSELGLQLKLEPGLLDEVGQEQADMVMAMIGGRSVNDAIEMLVDIEPLVDGLLAEQLNYRHALALVLTGSYDQALTRAKAATEADDPLVKARGQLLFDVLSRHRDGQYQGQALKSDAVLVTAIMAHLDAVQKKIFADLAAVHADQPLDAEIFAAVHAKLDAVVADLNTRRQTWPGYFDRARQVLKQHRTTLYQTEYQRITGELKAAHRAYLQLKGATDFVSGPDWSQPGHWPARETQEVNRQAKRFNDLLQHYYMVETSVPAAQRSPLPAALARSLEPLKVAVPRAG